MGTLNMRIGSNLPEILLGISQEHINNGEPEKAIEIYVESLHGFTKEYAMMLLKNEAVLVVDEENQTMNLETWEILLNDNKKNIYDWEYIVKHNLQSLKELKESISETIKAFNSIRITANEDINDCSLFEIMKTNFDDNQIKQIGVHNLAAHLIAHGHLGKGYGNGDNVWDHLVDNVESDDAYDYERALYLIVKYVEIIKVLHKDFVKFDKMYNFLLENKLINRIPMVENYMEGICHILHKFTDTSKGYYHPMCNVELYNYKESLLDDLCHTTFGLEYCQNKILKKNIEDGYDAGWLSPNGEFFGANGDTSSLIHMNIAEDIKGGTSIYANCMEKDGVTIFGDLSPEQWLIKEGWLKIHHDEIYGYFKYSKDDKPLNNKDYKLYCPTEKQIEEICKYVDKFYNKKFYTKPSILSMGKRESVTTYKLKQMDEFQLHNTFSN